MANNGPLGSDTNPGLIDGGTSALTHHRPPGPLCASRPTDTQLEHHLGRLLHHLSVATGWIDTSSVIGSLLGNGSFTAGVVAGMGKNLVTSLVDLTRLFRMFALAEYHQAHHAPSFWERLGHRVLYETMPLGGMSVSALTFGTGIDLEAEKAFEDRQALFKAVAYAFEHPGEVFDKITAQQLAKYEEFKRDGARHTLSGDFHAGLLFGELLLDVLLIIDGATALAKLGAKVPGLLRMASRLEELAPALRRALKTGGAAAQDAGTAAERVTPSQLRSAARQMEDRPPQTEPVPRERTNAEKGVFGEARADSYMNEKKFEKLNGKLVEEGDAPKGRGIDGVWKNTSPPPDYVVTEAKYGTSQLGTLKDGTRQLSESWIDDRLEREVGDETARKIIKSDYERWVLRVDSNGNVTKIVLPPGKP